MNYPIWEVPAAGLLIAAVAVLHVFISHFAVGGGMFLVLLERRARRDGDHQLLRFVQAHTRFFVLVTLVLGAVTGVGIWFTISLVHPSATSNLIQIFVWIWAIEWTFFVTEIVAALVYYYGWGRLTSRTHLLVGWIYFGSAWLSLAAVNGILTFMLTPAEWLTTRSLWDGFFNPTYWPGLVTRTVVAMGLAGLYALYSTSLLSPGRLKEQLIRYAGLRWLIPAMACLPACLLWYLMAANTSGVPTFRVLGSNRETLGSTLAAILSLVDVTGIPSAQHGAWVTMVSSAIVLSLALVAVYRRAVHPSMAIVLLMLGLTAFGGAEWVREDLRKPFVLGGQMFVNGVRLPGQTSRSPFTIDALRKDGVLSTALWRANAPSTRRSESSVSRKQEDGREIFRLLCSSCHTQSGHLGIRGLVRGQTPAALENLLDQLALPVDDTGQATNWSDPRLRLRTWRGRRMPPFAGTETEKRSLSAFLASLNGEVPSTTSSMAGQRLFQQKCRFCHGPSANWPMQRIARGMSAAFFYTKIENLPSISPIMPPFEGSELERKALAQYLESVAKAADSTEVGQ